MADKIDVTYHEDAMESKQMEGAEGTHSVGDALLMTSEGAIRRLPIPSNDPNDPLNFSKWEKSLVILACCWFSIMALTLNGALGAILVTFFKMYLPQGHTTEQIVQLLTLPALFVGVGNYIVLPLSLAFGRRPVFLGAVVVTLGVTIGAAVQNSYEAHLAMRIIQGLAAGACESLLPLMLTDITFLHQRGKVFGFYWATQNIFSSLLGLAGSYEGKISWRLFYWVYVIAIAIGLVLAFFGGFETRYRRPATSLDGQIVFTDDFGVTRVMSDEEAQAYSTELTQIETTSTQPAKKTYLQMLHPWSGAVENPGRIILMSYVHMLEAFTSPGIVFATLVASIVLGCSIGASLTYNTVLETIYGWPAENVGLINIGGIIGGAVGMIYGGLLTDVVVLRLAKRNHGVHKPEHLLVMLIFPAVLGIGSLILYGYTAGGGYSWWGPFMGWTLFQVVFVTVLIITTAFAAEAWPKNPGPAMVVVIGSKNLISFGATYGLTPMVSLHGYRWAFGVLAGILGAIMLLGLPVYFLNPTWRAYVGKKEKAKSNRSQD